MRNIYGNKKHLAQLIICMCLSISGAALATEVTTPSASQAPANNGNIAALMAVAQKSSESANAANKNSSATDVVTPAADLTHATAAAVIAPMVNKPAQDKQEKQDNKMIIPVAKANVVPVPAAPAPSSLTSSGTASSMLIPTTVSASVPASTTTAPIVPVAPKSLTTSAPIVPNVANKKDNTTTAVGSTPLPTLKPNVAVAPPTAVTSGVPTIPSAQVLPPSATPTPTPTSAEQSDALIAQLEIEIDSTAKYKVFTLSNPDRLIVDVYNGKANTTFDKSSLADTPIKNIRTGVRSDGTTRIVFDLTKMLGFKTSEASDSKTGHKKLVISLSEDQPKATSVKTKTLRKIKK